MLPRTTSTNIIARLERDIAITLGDSYRLFVADATSNVRLLDIADRNQKLVDDVQQTIHDEFIDTTWPACPRHVQHPLWFHDGAWWCEQDAVAVAPIGELSRAF